MPPTAHRPPPDAPIAARRFGHFGRFGRCGRGQARPRSRLISALGVALAAVGCAPPGPRGPEADTDALRARLAVGAPVAADISYLQAGDRHGPRVILVHGTPGSASGWADYLLNPPPGLDLRALDRPGFGRSGPAGAMTSLATQAAAVLALMDDPSGLTAAAAAAGVADTAGGPAGHPAGSPAINPAISPAGDPAGDPVGNRAADPAHDHATAPAPAPRRVVLVGHSLGGPVVAWVAAMHPSRVAGLVLLSASLDPAQEQTLAIQRMGAWGPVRALLPRAIRNANAELMALQPELEALAVLLPRIQAKVVIVHGTLDDLVPVANVPYMQARLTGARCVQTVLLAGRNHFLPWNSEGDVRAAIAAALEPGC